MHASLQERPLAEQQAVREAAGVRRRRIAAAVSLPLLVLAAGASYVSTSEPFADSGGVFSAGIDAGGFSELRADSRTTTFAGSPEITVVDPPVGSRFGVLLTLHNEGRLPVEVVDVELPVWGGYYLDEPLAYASTAPGGSGLPLVPLEPFTLSSGQGRDVGVSYRLTGCTDGPTVRSSGGINTFPSVIVRWRLAGIPRTSEVPLDGVAGIQGLPHCASTG